VWWPLRKRGGVRSKEGGGYTGVGGGGKTKTDSRVSSVEKKGVTGNVGSPEDRGGGGVARNSRKKGWWSVMNFLRGGGGKYCGVNGDGGG